MRGDNNLVRLYGVHGDTPVQVKIWFEAPDRWIAAQTVSLAGAALLAFALARMNRPGRPARSKHGKRKSA